MTTSTTTRPSPTDVGSSSPSCSPCPWSLFAWVPAARPPGWEWVSFALATPVVFYAGWPFHRAAATNARHGAATMDTLISVGTLAAWVWSTVVLLAGISAERLLRYRRGDHRAHPARPLLRGTGEASLGRGDPQAPRARRRKTPECSATESRCSSPPKRSASASCSSSGLARRSLPTASYALAPQRSTSRC